MNINISMLYVGIVIIGIVLGNSYVSNNGEDVIGLFTKQGVSVLIDSDANWSKGMMYSKSSNNDEGIIILGTSIVYQTYTFNLKVMEDKETDSYVQYANVTLYDKNGYTVFTLNTDSNGTIQMQNIVFVKWIYPYDNSVTAYTEYYPFTLIITKNEYETVNMSINYSIIEGMELKGVDLGIVELKRDAKAEGEMIMSDKVCRNCGNKIINNSRNPYRWKFCCDKCCREYHLRKSITQRDDVVRDVTIEKAKRVLHEAMIMRQQRYHGCYKPCVLCKKQASDLNEEIDRTLKKVK